MLCFYTERWTELNISVLVQIHDAQTYNNIILAILIFVILGMAPPPVLKIIKQIK